MGVYIYRLIGAKSFTDIKVKGETVRAYHYKFSHSLNGAEPKGYNSTYTKLIKAFVLPDVKIEYIISEDLKDVYYANNQYIPITWTDTPYFGNKDWKRIFEFSL